MAATMAPSLLLDDWFGASVVVVVTFGVVDVVVVVVVVVMTGQLSSTSAGRPMARPKTPS